MKRNPIPSKAICVLIAAALTLNAALALGADAPAREAEAARAQAEKARGDAEAQRTQAEKARAEAEHELDEMRGQMRELSRKMADVSAKLGDVGPRNYAYRYLGDPNHAMIGVVLGGGSHGVHINAVTPGGPADKAGVRHGDILVAVDGKRVTDEDHAMESLRDLKVDQNVKLTVLRDGKDTEIAVKASGASRTTSASRSRAKCCRRISARTSSSRSNARCRARRFPNSKPNASPSARSTRPSARWNACA